MKKYFSLQMPASYLRLFSWLIVIIITLVSLKVHPLSAAMTGDEPYYLSEVNYLSHYGFYQSLAQGTSLGYSGVLFTLSKIIPVNMLVLMKLFSAACFIASCFVILKIFDRFKNINFETKYLGMVFFAYFSCGFIWRALPDIANTLFIFIAVLILLKNLNYKTVIAAGMLIFLAFTFKPVALFYIPGILLYLLLNKKFPVKKNIIQIVIFLGVFSSCFGLYHIPGYKAYGKLMLEDKNHFYEGSKRVEIPLNWPEINYYYVLYNPNNRVNEWHVNLDEVNEFKKNNPGKLDMTYSRFLQKHFDVWTKVTATKIFLDLPYFVDCGMFYHKWTFINKWINSMMAIKFISLVIFVFFCYKERNFIAANPAFVIPLLYYVFLSLYMIIPLQENWIISCMPFFALPILGFLQKKIGAYIILFGQLLVVFFIA